MHWLFSHPYTIALVFAGILLLVGGVVVVNRAPVQPEGEEMRWGGVGTNLQNPLQSAAGLRQENARQDLYAEVLKGPPFFYGGAPAQIPTVQPGGDDFDFEGFLASLTRRSSESNAGDSSTPDAYSFIPRGLLSIASHEKERTETQQKLYDYGNEVGSYIETYESTNHNAPQILKDQFEDRQDGVKNDALRGLASGLSRVGASLGGMEEVPGEVDSAHARLAASYVDMGEKLAGIPDATSDQALLDAMLTYNASVEAFSKNFVALAILFSAHGVSFTPEDPGSVFTFTQASF